MASDIKTVSDMAVGEHAVVRTLDCSGALRRRLIDLGLLPGAHIVMLGAAPMGDPVKLRVRGCALSLRRAEAATIGVRSVGNL